MARRSPDPIKAIFQIAGAISKVSKAIDRANARSAREANKQARDRVRQEKENERYAKSAEKERQRAFKENLREQEKSDRDEAKERTREQKEIEKQEKADEKDQLRKLNALEKQKLLERKQFLKEIKETLSSDTIKEFKLGTIKEQQNIVQINYEINNEIKFVQNKLKEQFTKKFSERSISLDDLVWSGVYNSVIGDTGLGILKRELTQLDFDINSKITIEDSVYWEIIHSTGVYNSNDINLHSANFRWLTAYRLITALPFEETIKFLENTNAQNELIFRAMDSSVIQIEDLIRLRAYLSEFKKSLEQEIAHFFQNKLKTKLVA